MRILRTHAMLLAAFLQVLPLCRNLCTHPSVASAFAIVFRWGPGATAMIGAFDAVSGATTVIFTRPATATSTVGVAFNFKVTIDNNGRDKGAVFSALPLPAGLTSSTFDNPPPVSNVCGVISDTPTQATNNMLVTTLVSGKAGWGTSINRTCAWPSWAPLRHRLRRSPTPRPVRRMWRAPT